MEAARHPSANEREPRALRICGFAAVGVSGRVSAHATHATHARSARSTPRTRHAAPAGCPAHRSWLGSARAVPGGARGSREARGVRLQVCEPPGTGKSLGTGVEGVWGRAWVAWEEREGEPLARGFFWG